MPPPRLYRLLGLQTVKEEFDMAEKTENKKEEKKEGKKPIYQKKKCFLICPIGDPGSIEWKRSGQLEEFILKPALGDEYDIKRADKIPDPGMIPPQIIERLIDDDLVVADLTDTNSNVFYELAVRHAIQKPFIHLMEETQLRAKKIPFDNAPMRTIPYPGDFDSDKTKDCRMKIREAVKAAVANPDKLHSPISIAKIDKIILDLKSSGGSRDEVVGQIFEILKEMQTRLSDQYPVLQSLEWTPAPSYFPYGEFTGAPEASGLRRNLITAKVHIRSMLVRLQAATETTDREVCRGHLSEATGYAYVLSQGLIFSEVSTNLPRAQEAMLDLQHLAEKIRGALLSTLQTKSPTAQRTEISFVKRLVAELSDKIEGFLESFHY